MRLITYSEATTTGSVLMGSSLGTYSSTSEMNQHLWYQQICQQNALNFHQQILNPYTARDLTPEELAREEERRAARLIADSERRQAKEKARELLLQNLTPEQQETFEKNNWFVVEGGRSKSKYRIRTGTYAGNVDILDKHGKAITRLCCHCDSQILPHYADQFLAQKLMLEFHEDEFLRVANRSRA